MTETVDHRTDSIEPGAARSIRSPFDDRHVAVISAHCDDEILGIGGQLATMRRVSIIHLTDSAPSDRIARAHGFADRYQYCAARQDELHRALAQAAPHNEWQCFSLGLPDGRASFHMHAACAELAALLSVLKPEIIVSQPYEGGHPDHDTVALTTRAALALSGLTIPHWEMSAYHFEDGAERLGRFLSTDQPGPICLELDPAIRAVKAAALSCFTSQRMVVERFPLDWEEFRLAPDYDFERPPHAGRLLYEGRRRAISSRLWRSLAADMNDRRRHSLILQRVRTAIWSCWLPG